MTLWQRSIGRTRAHWKIAWIPLGFAAIVYGNILYESPHQRLGMALFLGGWVVAVCGMPALKRFLEESPLREGNLKIALLTFFLLFLMTGPLSTAVEAVWGAAQPTDYRTATAAVVRDSWGS